MIKLTRDPSSDEAIACQGQDKIQKIMNIFQKLTQYLKDAKSELKKVVWPTRKQTINHTLLVIGFSLGMALFLGAADYLLNYLFKKLII